MRIARISMLSLIVTLLLASMLLPHVVSAQRLFPSIVPNCDQNLIKNSATGKYSTDKQCDFGDFIQMFVNLFDWGLAILSVLSVTFIIIGGLILLIAAGNENRIKTGKAILVNTVIGIIIALASWLIINSVIGLLVGNGKLKDVQVFGRLWWGTPSCAAQYSTKCTKNNLYEGCGDVTSTYVEELQRKLNNAPGCEQISVDGCFGPQTSAAVKAFNIAALGVQNEEEAKKANADTWTALNDGKSCSVAINTKNPRIAGAGETPGCCVTSCGIQGFENTPEHATNPPNGEGCKDLLSEAVWYSDAANPGKCRVPESQTTDGCCITIGTSACYNCGNRDWCTSNNGIYYNSKPCSDPEIQSKCSSVTQCGSCAQ